VEVHRFFGFSLMVEIHRFFSSSLTGGGLPLIIIVYAEILFVNQKFL
jgi:hypothetical protein